MASHDYNWKKEEKKKPDDSSWTQKKEENSGQRLNSITGRQAYVCALTFHSLVRLVDPQIWIHSFDRSLAL